MSVVKSKKKKVVVLGFPNPFRMRDKSYVLQKIYDRAKTNPFIADMTYDDYLKFLCAEIEKESEGSVKLNPGATDSIYNELKRMGWIRVISRVLMAVSTHETYIA